MTSRTPDSYPLPLTLHTLHQTTIQPTNTNPSVTMPFVKIRSICTDENTLKEEISKLIENHSFIRPIVGHVLRKNQL